MRSLLIVPAAVFALTIPLAGAAAQTCRGTASFSDGHVQLGARGNFESHKTGYVGEGAFGTPGALYATAHVGQTHFEGGSPNATDFGGSLGYQFPVSDSPAQFCPYVLASHASVSPANSTTWGFGGGLGYSINGSGSFAFVPAAGVQWQSTHSSGGVGSVNSTLFWVNGGFVLNRTLTISPGVLIPTRSGQDNILTLGMSVNLAR